MTWTRRSRVLLQTSQNDALQGARQVSGASSLGGVGSVVRTAASVDTFDASLNARTPVTIS